MRKVTTGGQFIDAVRSGVLAIAYDGAIEVPEPINMADHYRWSQFTLCSSGGWTGGAIYRKFDGPAPVLYFPRYHKSGERHWELRMQGCNWDQNAHEFPNAGPSLQVELMQLSYLEDQRFQGHQSTPFRFGAPYLKEDERPRPASDGNVNSCTFENFSLLDNKEAGELVQASDFIWRGGNIERTPGLLIEGPSRKKPNTYAEPGRVEDVHMEFSGISVFGVDRLYYRNRYRFWSDVHFHDCRNLWSDHSVGTSAFSDVYRDGRKIREGSRVPPGAG